jgi:hypothetical protein
VESLPRPLSVLALAHVVADADKPRHRPLVGEEPRESELVGYEVIVAV